MEAIETSLLAAIEPRLRTLLPADLYAKAWLDPSSETLTQVFKHLQTLQRILMDYVPGKVSESLPHPGQLRWEWHEGTLLFTDLKGFTPLMEAHAPQGRAGAFRVLGLLSDYFSQMIEIVGKSGGNLLEFTGDAMLVEFEADARRRDTARAVRAGLRMQRAMERFACIETEQGDLSLQMRVGIHTGRFLTADIGTPRRMTHVLLGHDVHSTKLAEGAGEPGKVCLTETTYQCVMGRFHCVPGKPGYYLVSTEATGELDDYEATVVRRRAPRAILLDSSVPGLLSEIETTVRVVEPVACYLPASILNLLVENTGRHEVAPQFTNLAVMFVSLAGLADAADRASPEEEAGLIGSFSRVFALINAAVEAGGGVLKDVTYHPQGSGALIYFGVPNAHTDDPIRAARAALAIRDAIVNQTPPVIGGAPTRMTCQIGLSYGPAFAGEIGEPRGRRDFNIHSDSVNTAARLMGRAAENQILMTEAMHQQVESHFECEYLGAFSLKGKSAPVPLYVLRGLKED